MKFVIAICVMQISIGSAYILNPVQGVNNRVEALNFDLSGNIFVATTNGSNRSLHKLNPSRELLWTIEFPFHDVATNKIFINSRNDIYLHFLGDFTLAVLKSNSTTIEKVDENVGYLIFMDTDENLIYCKIPGCYLLRPNLTIPTAIENLEDFYYGYPSEAAIDNEGNFYFMGIFGDDSKMAVIFLTRQALQENVPFAKVFRNFADPYPQLVGNYFVDEKNDLWVFLINYKTYQGTIKKISNNTVETILNTDRPEVKGILAKNRIYVAAYDYYNEKDPTIFYTTLENEIIEVPELENLTPQKYFSIRLSSDEDGYTYFQTDSELTPKLGSMIVIKPNETEPISIGFDSSKFVVGGMFLDYNNDVWIFDVAGDMYFLEKGKSMGQKIRDFRDVCTAVSSNSVTKEVFFSCSSGLYVAKRN